MKRRYRLAGMAIALSCLTALCSCPRVTQRTSGSLPPQLPEAPELDRGAAVSQLGFDEASLTEFEQATGAELEPILGMEGDLRGVQVAVTQARLETTLAHVRTQLVPKGYLVFVSDQGFGREPPRLGIVKGTDPYDILRAMQTDGANYDITNEQVIAKLKAWEERYPFAITGAGLDWAEVKFESPPAGPEAFAGEVYAFCPDIVDQGTGSVSALAEEISKTQTLFLWWD